MDFICEVCDGVVHASRMSTETRCIACEPSDEYGEHAERSAIQKLLDDTHEKGRGTPPPLAD